MNRSILKRIYVIYTVLIVLAVAVIWKIAYTQFFADIEITDVEMSFRHEEIEANRGAILAHDGRPLSVSVPYFQIRIDCLAPADSIFNKHVAGLAKELSQFFKDKSSSAYETDLKRSRTQGKRYKAIGNRLVDYSEMLVIKQFPLFNLGVNRGGFIAEKRNRRNTPYGRLAYRTIGFINTQGVGVGIEGSYDFYLRGIPGSQTVQRMLGEEWVPVNSEDVTQPRDGYDIQTTIDIDIQECVEDALREQLAQADVFEGATAIVMDVKSGAIRAIANMKRDGNNRYDESYNYAIGHATEPGSTFKLATLVALLEDGLVKLDTPVDAESGIWSYKGTMFTDVGSGGYGKIDVLTAFEKSSNVAFAKLATEYYAGNEKKYVDRIMNMKLNERFNLDIMGEARAVMYTPSDPLWSSNSLPMMAIGYFSLITPMHTLTFYNAIANNGKMVKPYFIENLQRNGVIEKNFPPQQISGSICSKKTIEAVHKALRGVVENGTAKPVNNDKYQISGKTGTAQIAFDGKYRDAEGNRKHQASFAGFFPSDNPKYSAIVVLYTNKTKANFYGGTWAAPVFKKIADKIYATSPEWKEPVKTESTAPPTSYILAKADTESVAKGIVPDVTNMGLRDALYLLENMDYKVKFSGRGVIVGQSPDPGTELGFNGLVELQLSDKYVVK